MSTLAVGTIKSVSSAAPVFQNTSGTEKGQLVKAYVSFDGTTNSGGNCSIYDSFNVDSVSDNGTGDYTVNFTGGTFSNGNYCISGSISFGTTQSRNILNVATTAQTTYTAPTATALRLESVNYGNGNSYDANFVSIAIFGG